MIKLYTSPTCGSCRSLKMQLKNNNIDFVEVDVASNSAAADELVEQGFMGLPVIQIEDNYFYGLNIDQIKELINKQ